MTLVTSYSADELRERRRQILDDFGMSLEEFRQRAQRYGLAGREWEAWNNLRAVAFLLGDDES